MTREDIIRMAREAGAELAELPMMDAFVFSVDDKNWNSACLERFAALVAQRVLAGSYPEMIALVAAAERERLANARAVGNRAYDRYEGETK